MFMWGGTWIAGRIIAQGTHAELLETGGGIVKAGNAGAVLASPVASSSGASSGGDVSIQFAPVFQFAASTPEGLRAEMQKAIDEMTPAMLARLLAGLRQNSRDSREGPRT